MKPPPIDLAVALSRLRAQEEPPVFQRITSKSLPENHAWVWDTLVAKWWKWESGSAYDRWLEPQNRRHTHWHPDQPEPPVGRPQ